MKYGGHLQRAFPQQSQASATFPKSTLSNSSQPNLEIALRRSTHIYSPTLIASLLYIAA
jgi:hypothetical protein